MLEYETGLCEAATGLTFSGPATSMTRDVADVLRRFNEVKSLIGKHAGFQSLSAFAGAMQSLVNKEYTSAQASLRELIDSGGVSARLDVARRSLLGAVILISGERGKPNPDALRQFEIAHQIASPDTAMALTENGLSACYAYRAEELARNNNYEQALEEFRKSRDAAQRASALDRSAITQFKFANNSAYVDALLLHWVANDHVEAVEVLKATRVPTQEELIESIRMRLERASHLFPGKAVLFETRAEFLAVLGELDFEEEGALHFRAAAESLCKAINAGLFDESGGERSTVDEVIEGLGDDTLLMSLKDEKGPWETVTECVRKHLENSR